MFDFEKLSVYLKAKEFNKKIHVLLSENNLDRTTNDQLRRASVSIMLNYPVGRHFKLHFIDFYADSGEPGAPKFKMQEL